MKRTRRSDRDREKVFSYFTHKALRMTLFSLKPIVATGKKHAASLKKHEDMLKKSRKKFLAKIKSWIKRKLSIFKVK